MSTLQGLSPQQKKEHVNNQIANGSMQGYNSLMADLELAIWREARGIQPPELRAISSDHPIND